MLPASIRRTIWKLLPAAMRAARTSSLALSGTDLSRSTLFSTLHDGHAALRINLRGRESPGLISIEEGEALIDELEALAMSFRSTDGQPAFIDMMRPQDRFPGPRAHWLPDALLMTNPGVKGTSALHGTDITLRSDAKEARNGVHTGRGFCFLQRKAGTSVNRTRMDNQDFAPTVLELLGAPATTTLDGASILS